MTGIKKTSVGPYKLIGASNVGIINTGIESKEQAIHEATTYAHRAGVSVTIKDAEGTEIVTVPPLMESLF